MTVRLTVRAKPKAKKSRVVHASGLSVEIALAAPPVDGAANEELVSFLAAVLSVRKRDVTIAIGGGSKHKVVDVEGVDEADACQRLAQSCYSTRP